MKRNVVQVSAAIVLTMLTTPPLQAADNAAMSQHSAMHGAGMTMAPDGRELVQFPPDMRAHQLRDMRDHVAVLDGILRALSEGDYEGAANLAEQRLGLDSPSAAGCKAREPGSPPAAKGSMEEMMNLYMPEQMRAFGLAMHSSASEFAKAARASTKVGEARPAFQALSEVTRYCVACHAAYRTQ